MKKKSWIYPDDFKQDVREMLADGLTVANVAWYLSVSYDVVAYIADPIKHKNRAKLYNKKNKTRVNKWRVKYNKKYHKSGLKEALQKDELHIYSVEEKRKRLDKRVKELGLNFLK